MFDSVWLWWSEKVGKNWQILYGTAMHLWTWQILRIFYMGVVVTVEVNEVGSCWREEPEIEIVKSSDAGDRVAKQNT